MAAGEMAERTDDRSSETDVLRRLRAGTAQEHEDVERILDLLDPGLDRRRLAEVLDRMHGFWAACEADLDQWAARSPGDAAAVTWPRRRRARLFAADLHALGRRPTDGAPYLPPLRSTDEALGRMYVLEGSTLGGTFIDRHLASLPHLADVRVHAFAPYGSETGAMWAAFRRATRERVAAGGDADVLVDSARATFRALAAWCHTAASAQAVPA